MSYTKTLAASVTDEKNGTGVKSYVTICNYDDIDFTAVTKDPANDMLLTGFALKAGGKQAFRFDVLNKNGLRPESTATGQANGNFGTHAVEFDVHNASADAAKAFDELMQGHYVAITEEINGRFTVYGIDSGLILTEGERAPNNTDRGVAYRVRLGTPPDVAGEPSFPKVLLATDYDTTKALVDGLLTPTT